MFKKTVAISVLAILSFFLTGCMKFNLDLSVNDKDEVSGSMILAFNKQALALSESMGGSQILDPDQLITENENMTVETYDDEEFSGSKIIFAAVPMTEFASGATGESLKFVRDGNIITVSGVIDMAGTDPTALDAAKNNPLTSGFFDTSDISVSITLPGSVSSTNGKVEGNKVTFSGQLGDKILIDAKADTSNNMALIAMVGGVAIALAAAGGATALIIRNRKKRTASEPASTVETENWDL